MFASRDRRTIKIGTDPSTLRISRKHGTPGLLEMIQKMLAVDPAERAVASLEEEHGIMGQITRCETLATVWSAHDNFLVLRNGLYRLPEDTIFGKWSFSCLFPSLTNLGLPVVF